MLGGTGDSQSIERPLTEIELNVVDSVIKVMLDHLTETWRAVTNVQFKIHARETRPQMLQVTAPMESLLPVFDRGHVAIVMDGKKFLGLITRIDLLNFLRRRAQ